MLMSAMRAGWLEQPSALANADNSSGGIIREARSVRPSSRRRHLAKNRDNHVQTSIFDQRHGRYTFHIQYRFRAE
jgi:hypothetical protein